MGLQFRLASMFGVVTFLSISLGGIGVAWEWLVPVQRAYLAGFVVYLSPFWLAFVVTAYSLGRRAIKWWLVLVLAFSEAATVVTVTLLNR